MRARRALWMAAVAGLCLSGCRESSSGAAGADTEPGLPVTRASEDFAWPRVTQVYEPLHRRFPVPGGFERVDASTGGWEEWLRHLPLRPPNTPVVDEQGGTILRGNSRALGAVVDMDVRKHQECADVILRLRAEYLRWAGRNEEIVFNLTGGGKVSWPNWQQGYRPRVRGGNLSFSQTARADSSRRSFDKYLGTVFGWCGTLSLSTEGRHVEFAELRIGDFLVHGGSPGHAVLMVDLAVNEQGAKRGLLLQGYMPAQSVHVLAVGGEPWFELEANRPVDTPLWGEFTWDELRRS